MTDNRISKIRSLETRVDLSSFGFSGKIIHYFWTVNIPVGYNEFGQPQFKQVEYPAVWDFKLEKLNDEK